MDPIQDFSSTPRYSNLNPDTFFMWIEEQITGYGWLILHYRMTLTACIACWDINNKPNQYITITVQCAPFCSFIQFIYSRLNGGIQATFELISYILITIFQFRRKITHCWLHWPMKMRAVQVWRLSRKLP